jgi:ketosteroid isomerase-like protein
LLTRDTLSSTVDQFYRAFMENDLELLARVVTDDFCVDLPVLRYVPLDPEYRGIEGFRKLMRDREAGRINYTFFREHERMVDADRVAVLGRTEGTAGLDARAFAHDWVHLFRFDGDRIRLLKEYLDTSKVSDALAP